MASKLRSVLDHGGRPDEALIAVCEFLTAHSQSEDAFLSKSPSSPYAWRMSHVFWYVGTAPAFSQVPECPFLQ